MARQWQQLWHIKISIANYNDSKLYEYRYSGLSDFKNISSDNFLYETCIR